MTAQLGISLSGSGFVDTELGGGSVFTTEVTVVTVAGVGWRPVG